MTVAFIPSLTVATGPSRSFVDVISNTLEQLSNGIEYDTVYPAGEDQNTTLAVQDIISTINDGLNSCPDQVYALLGYSQGATATLDTLNNDNLSQDARDVIKAVILVGNPYRIPGQESNAEGFGSDDAEGIWAADPKAISDDFDASGRVLDFCLSVSMRCWCKLLTDKTQDDCICNVACNGDKMGHTDYENNEDLIQQATQHLVDHLP